MERSGFTVIGVEVVGSFAEPGYREVLGVVAPDTIQVPEDMHTAYVPAGRFLHHRHEGPVRGIADSFGAMYGRVAQQGLQVALWRVDAGYRPDGREEAHDLYLGAGVAAVTAAGAGLAHGHRDGRQPGSVARKVA